MTFFQRSATFSIMLAEPITCRCSHLPEEADRISYAFQLAPPIFQQLDAWISTNSESLSMDEFYKHIEYSMGIHMLTERAEEKLHTVSMKPNNNTVDEYYDLIFKLWQ